MRDIFRNFGFYSLVCSLLSIALFVMAHPVYMALGEGIYTLLILACFLAAISLMITSYASKENSSLAHFTLALVAILAVVFVGLNFVSY